MPESLKRNWSWAVLTLVVGVLIGALGTRIALSGVPVLSEGYIDALVGALVGGVFVLIGGVIGAAYLGGLERDDRNEREQSELTGSALLVLYEMAHDVTLLRTFARNEEAVGFPINLSSAALTQVQAVLARGLPAPLMIKIRVAYSILQVAQDRVEAGRQDGRMNDAERQHLLGIAARMDAAEADLIEHIEAKLGYKLPELNEEEIQQAAGAPKQQ